MGLEQAVAKRTPPQAGTVSPRGDYLQLTRQLWVRYDQVAAVESLEGVQHPPATDDNEEIVAYVLIPGSADADSAPWHPATIPAQRILTWAENRASAVRCYGADR